jgi:hypothetical protein
MDLFFKLHLSGAYLKLNIVHAIILERGRGFGILFWRDAKWCDLGPFQGFI